MTSDEEGHDLIIHRVRALERTVGRLNDTIFGNGRAGLHEQLASIRAMQKIILAFLVPMAVYVVVALFTGVKE